MITRKALADTLSRPGIRLRGPRRMPLPSRVAVCFLALVVLVALLAPLIARTTRSTSRIPWTAAGIRRPGTGWARTASAATSSAG